MKNIHFKFVLCFFFFSIFAKTSFTSNIDSIQLVIDKGELILPGHSFKFGVIAYKRNGKIRKTIGLTSGNVFWWKYKVDVVGGTFFNGKVNVNEALSPSKGKYLALSVVPRKKPSLKKSVLLPLNYETDITFQATNNFDKAPGSQIDGEIISAYNNETIQIFDNLKRKKEFEKFTIETDGGHWEKGSFMINPDFRAIKNHQVNLVVHPNNNLELSDTFSILLDYKHHYHQYFKGNSGFSAFSGSDGMNGSTGYHGQDGQNGRNGEYGENGPDVGVWVDLYFDSILNIPLLYVYSENFWTGENFRFLINPDGGKLTVRSDGGNGGDGGDGGDGGNGGNGADGEIWIEKKVEKKLVSKPFQEKRIIKEKKNITNSEGKQEEIEVEKEISVTVYKMVEEEVVVEIKHQKPGYDGGDGGYGGAGGFGAEGGNGGYIFLYFTNDAAPYQHCITAYTSGGSGGKHGDGGDGGRGGNGGSGNPNGRSGSDGMDGPEAMGWADDGWDGQIEIGTTDEFFFYTNDAEQNFQDQE